MAEKGLRIAIADDDRDTREYLTELLPRMGHEVVAAVEDGRALASKVLALHPDLVITDIKMQGKDGIEAAQDVNREQPTPFILLSGHHDDELLLRATQGAHAMAYLIKPVTEADLRSTIPMVMKQFQMMRGLMDETASLRQAIEDRKLIERAKGILMKRLRLDEDDAFRRMRQLASSQNRKLTEVSRQISSAEEVFQRLEAVR